MWPVTSSGCAFATGQAARSIWRQRCAGPIFEPLRNPAVFSQFQIHPEFHTLVWPNGADIAPEFLHDNLRVTA